LSATHLGRGWALNDAHRDHASAAVGEAATDGLLGGRGGDDAVIVL